MSKCDALRDLVPLVQFTKRENTHGGVLLLVKLEAKANGTIGTKSHLKFTLM